VREAAAASSLRGGRARFRQNGGAPPFDYMAIPRRGKFFVCTTNTTITTTNIRLQAVCTANHIEQKEQNPIYLGIAIHLFGANNNSS